ncbi:MAG TPA: tRNA lysidine(34) synthetase TilS [Ferruginibacter sp.]|nr:tRNA lysidine(34) synthetase TilS [Ferruginibacter sp.]
MDLLKEFKQFINQQNLFQETDKLLLAVSGGVDSVVLCELCKQAGYDFTVLHCNFQLRGEESERDEKFVRDLAIKYGVQVIAERFDTKNYAAEMKLGIQEAARDLRYHWFGKVCAEKTFPGFSMPIDTPGWHSPIDRFENGKWYVATAHHLNDSIETMLMNFFKGTGIKGMTGISPKHDTSWYMVRPLLFASRTGIEQYANENGLSWVEDSSNASDKYTRNYFRNKLIPGIREVFPQVEHNLADNLSRFVEIELLYEQALQHHKKKLLELKGNEIHIPVLKLLKAVPLATIVYEIIKDFGFTARQVNDVISLLKAESGRYVASDNYRIIKNRNWLIISQNDSSVAHHILIEETISVIAFEGGNLKIETLPRATDFRLQTSDLTAQLDAGEIKFPLLLRKWKQGDYFYPLGMKKKKKLSRFFIDQKLSLTQKEKTWVIEMNKKIVWVVGLRIDDRFKITEKTKNLLQISLSGAE